MAVDVSSVTVTPEVIVEAIEIDPEPLVMLIPVPGVNVVLVNPVPLPISNAPFAGVEVSPVPPEAMGSVPVVSAEVDVAYIAPPEVKDVNAVPPAAVGNVPAARAELDVE